MGSTGETGRVVTRDTQTGDQPANTISYQQHYRSLTFSQDLPAQLSRAEVVFICEK